MNLFLDSFVGYFASFDFLLDDGGAAVVFGWLDSFLSKGKQIFCWNMLRCRAIVDDIGHLVCTVKVVSS